MNTKIVDLAVDYIDSRSITKEELAGISAYIRNQKLRTTLPTERKGMVYRVAAPQRKKELA
jgi:hypothetical protein